MAPLTIYDVAKQAGVSIKTVSRVLNNEPSVKPATRDRVLEAAETLGYQPNLSARRLAGSKSFLIAAFVDAALTLEQWRSGRSAHYLTSVQLGATEECRKAAYHFLVELIDRDPPNVDREVRKVLAGLKPDGVLLTPPSCDDLTVLNLLAASGVPYVRLGAERPDGGGLQLRMDDRGAAAVMTDHLLDLGHRRIGFILGDPNYGASQARYDGYRDALKQRGLPLRESLVREGDFTFESGVEGAGALLRLPERPTAIFASNDDMALGCLAAVTEAGLAAPQDVSIAGFDDSAGGRSSRPALTTVRHPLDQLAALGVRALISGDGSAIGEDASAPLPFELLARRSTGPALIVRG